MCFFFFSSGRPEEGEEEEEREKLGLLTLSLLLSFVSSSLLLHSSLRISRFSPSPCRRSRSVQQQQQQCAPRCFWGSGRESLGVKKKKSERFRPIDPWLVAATGCSVFFLPPLPLPTPLLRTFSPLEAALQRLKNSARTKSIERNDRRESDRKMPSSSPPSRQQKKKRGAPFFPSLSPHSFSLLQKKNATPNLFRSPSSGRSRPTRSRSTPPSPPPSSRPSSSPSRESPRRGRKSWA